MLQPLGDGPDGVGGEGSVAEGDGSEFFVCGLGVGGGFVRACVRWEGEGDAVRPWEEEGAFGGCRLGESLCASGE